MGKVKGKHRLDKYYHLAKEQGYRSRAAFKLVQLEAKYNFLNSAHSVLDLCAAPGGWMQVAVQRVPVGSFILGVDLFPIRPVRGAISVEEDITTQKCRATIKKLMGDNACRAFNVVLHDGSPNVGGAWAQEATSQASLVVDAIRLATDFLAPKGTFVTKVFRSQDYNAVIFCLNQLFEKVEVTKPLASRSTSAEIFVVAQKYKAPAKIDPRLLDVKHLFQGTIEPVKVVDIFGKEKAKRNRTGYEDGDTTLRKVCSASDFVWSESPLDILGTVTSISFSDPASLPIKDHGLTTEEVKILCDDLRVLGKQDFKYLLKWRMNIRKALSPTKLPTAGAVEEDNEKDGGGNEIDDDDKLLNEMEELTYAMDRKKKREKKKLAKRLAKEKSRKATGMQIDGVTEDYVDHELFSLSSIKGKKDLEVVDSTELNDEKDGAGDSDNEAIHATPALRDSSSDIDSDEEHRRYDDQLEELLDQAYERYVSRTIGTAKQRKRAKRAYKDSKELLEDGDNNDDDGVAYSDHDSDREQVDSEANPLMIPLHTEVQPSQEQMTEQWFSQDIFVNSIEKRDTEKNESDDEMVDLPEEKISIQKKTTQNTVQKAEVSNIPQKKDETDDFEIVPAPATDSSDDSSSSDEESEEDIDRQAEIRAYAKKMLRKKQREQILDDAYNKYMFDDEGLPTWFLEEEKRHRQPIKPVTKEEIAAMKAQFKEIDARPAKKVAQAKARKKRSAMRKLEKVRKKANTISDQTDISERSKSKMIDQLYKKATPKRPKKEFVVAKKGVAVKGGKGKVIVDPRMKKDTRTRGMGRVGRGAKKGKGKKAAPKGKKGSAKASGRNGKKGGKGKSFD